MENIEIKSTCNEMKEFCDSCNSHFMFVRPLLKEVVISNHFKRDLKDEEEVDLIIKNILDCSHLDFTELHKFEGNVSGNLIFRAKRGETHIIYCVDKNNRIIFLRAIRNFDEYRKFLENKKEIKAMIESL
jgi:mRNA-degrading endonuclease RelE of RelBE toxin-antitoxin system